MSPPNNNDDNSNDNKNDKNESDNQGEGMMAHILRACSNSCTRCYGTVQKTDEYAKIKYKEHQMEHRQKQFGVDYIQLMTNTPNATEADQQACIDVALKENAVFVKEIEVLKQEIERINRTTKENMIDPPGTPTTTATTTSTAVEAPATTATTNTTSSATSAAVVEAPNTITTTPKMSHEDPPTMTDIPLTTTN